MEDLAPSQPEQLMSEKCLVMNLYMLAVMKTIMVRRHSRKLTLYFKERSRSINNFTQYNRVFR